MITTLKTLRYDDTKLQQKINTTKFFSEKTNFSFVYLYTIVNQSVYKQFSRCLRFVYKKLQFVYKHFHDIFALYTT